MACLYVEPATRGRVAHYFFFHYSFVHFSFFHFFIRPDVRRKVSGHVTENVGTFENGRPEKM